MSEHSDNSALVIHPPAQIAQAGSDDEVIQIWIRAKGSDKTRREYKRDIALFRRFTGSKTLNRIKVGELQDYQGFLERMNYSASSQARMTAVVKSLFTFAQKIGYLQFNAAAVLKLPAKPDRRGERIISESTVMQMIVTEKNPRNQLIIRTLFITGARVSELCNLRWRDLQAYLESGVLSLFGKGGKSRTVRLPRKLFDDLEALRGQENEKIFPVTSNMIWRIIKAAGRRAGAGDRISPHWLRHGHASAAHSRGASLKLVQETLGHQNLNTTGIYVHARPEDSSSLYVGIE